MHIRDPLIWGTALFWHCDTGTRNWSSNASLKGYRAWIWIHCFFLIAAYCLWSLMIPAFHSICIYLWSQTCSARTASHKFISEFLHTQSYTFQRCTLYMGRATALCHFCHACPSRNKLKACQPIRISFNNWTDDLTNQRSKIIRWNIQCFGLISAQNRIKTR